jgi:C-terminal processing protease CtpA/Prc
MSITTSASDLGRELYHAIWQLVNEIFFDTKRLADWGSLEHRFDELIVDEESALRYADEMLATLNDAFTLRLIEKSSLQPESDSSAAVVEVPKPIMALIRPDGDFHFAYLAIRTFDQPDIFNLVAAVAEKMADCDGVILDLRGNNGGRIEQALASCGLFLKDGLLATLENRGENGAIVKRQYALTVGEYFANIEQPDGSFKSRMYERPTAHLAGKPLVILINKGTASAAEVMVVALVQNGTVGKVLMVGGGETPGKGIGQTEHDVFDGRVKVKVTCTHWFAPGGEWLGDCGQTERNGIAPNIFVPDDHGPEGFAVAVKELRKMLGVSKS